MVENASRLTTASGEKIPLRRKLTCKNFGIYVATCTICKAQYVGQTITEFRKRWNNHRHTWKSFFVNGEGVEKSALLQHYVKHHEITLTTNPELENSFKVIFVEEPPVESLDVHENLWLIRIKATINIQKMILPPVR